MEIPLGKIFKRLRDNGRRESERRQEERRRDEQRKVVRATVDRRDTDQRNNDLRRTIERQRQDGIKRWLYAFFATHRMPKAADFIKSTKLIHPTVTFVTALLSAITYSPTMGLYVALGLVFVLSWHEAGHYTSTKKCGYDPRWWWNIPFLGAIMRLPEIDYRIDEAHIAYGGPAAGFWCSSFVSAVWFVFAPTYSFGFTHEWSQIIYTVAIASTVLNLFNLIPISPLDGGRISQAMSGYWPHALRVLGFVILVVVTTLTEQPSMVVVWILVIGEFRLSFGKYAVTPLLRFLIALSLLVVLVFGLVHGYHGATLWSKEFWEVLGELMYATLGGFMVWTYYARWKHPDEVENDWRNQSVLKADQAKMTKRYFLLVARLILLLVVLVYFSGRLHT